MVENFLADFKRWAAKPYDEEGNVGDWILFIGFMVAITYLWTRVVQRILT